MDAKELRIGNYVCFNNQDDYMKLSQHNFESLIMFNTYDRINPILLTKHWLKKLGFKNTYLFSFATEFTCYVDENLNITIEQYSEGRFNLTHIKYVHQLQNLYFALTGKELDIN